MNITNNILIISILTSVLCYGLSFSQEFDIPISKVRRLPTIIDNDSINIDKLPVNYKFFSFPYPSDFEPSKGSTIILKNDFIPKTYYSSYISFAYGSYGTPILKAYTINNPYKNHLISLKLSHHSSQRGIPKALSDTDFYRTDIVLKDNFSTEKYDFQSTAKLSQNIFQWYGFPERAKYNLSNIWGLNTQQTLYQLQLSSVINPHQDTLKQLTIQGNVTFDALNNKELNILSQLKSHLKINEQDILIDTRLDYVHARLGNERFHTTYNNLIISTSPYIDIIKDNIHVKAGVIIFLKNKTDDNSTIFNIYPMLYASHKILSNYIISYGGVSGRQRQNTYAKFIEKNSFVNPEIVLLPTNENLKIFFGVKGKVFSNLNYDINGFVRFENQKPLFKLSKITTLQRPFEYGNSFVVRYDKLTTFRQHTELSWNINQRLNINWNMEISSYKTSIEDRAWNMPTFKTGLFGYYLINDKIYLDTNIFVVGNRYDLYTDLRSGIIIKETIKLPSYLDANFRLEYRFSEYLTAFGEVNNLFGNNYMSVAHYRTQGQQLMIGATYKF